LQRYALGMEALAEPGTLLAREHPDRHLYGMGGGVLLVYLADETLERSGPTPQSDASIPRIPPTAFTLASAFAFSR
jgi:hypothetical protein